MTPRARPPVAPDAAPMRSSRSRWFAALVLLVALWPLAQRALVVRYGSDPWRLGGFAMYATYQSTQVALFRVEPGGLRLVDESTLPGAARGELVRFRRMRSALGRLASPDAAVRAVHDARPELEHLVVVVQRLWLDPATARVASEKQVLPYLGGEPFGDGGEGVPGDLAPPGT